MYMDCNIVHSVILHLSFSCRNNISASDYSFNFEKSNQYTIGFFFFTIITTDNENYAYGLYHKWSDLAGNQMKLWQNYLHIH